MVKGQILSLLPTFCIAAREKSFTRAANACHLTTGAVSQQMKQLEGLVGVALFFRTHRGIALTVEGEKLLLSSQRCINELDAVISGFKAPKTGNNTVKLLLTPSFALKWLSPRLPEFYNQHPEIRVQTFAEGSLVDEKTDDVDIIIDYQRHPHPNPDAKLILNEYITPVISAKHRPNIELKDSAFWECATLLHDAQPWPDSKPDDEWRYWFDSNKVPYPEDASSHYFNRTDMAMAASEAGLGIAMGRLAIIGKHEKKMLFSPFKPIPADAGYYLINKSNMPESNLFESWILSINDQIKVS
ncbi:LysR substrate-binding domain-containing protein [Parasalinivibrio latis]|uniref:LysR family transcriptional regulator n=1 Tax=Parasalinivibrio latis TaxID=2952610 RepID=UPI0030E519E1